MTIQSLTINQGKTLSEIINELKLKRSHLGDEFWSANFGDIEALIEMSAMWGISNNFEYD